MKCNKCKAELRECSTCTPPDRHIFHCYKCIKSYKLNDSYAESSTDDSKAPHQTDTPCSSVGEAKQ